jgi:small subunit ribosomal protein S9
MAKVVKKKPVKKLKEVAADKIEPKSEPLAPVKYIEAVGRRKTSIARVRLQDSRDPSINVNQKTIENYFPTYELRHIVEEPVKRSAAPPFSISIKVRGGGIHSQAEAVRHGISRALEKYQPELRKILKPLGFLKRDPRMKERRKFGLKKARKAPQWAKR